VQQVGVRVLRLDLDGDRTGLLVGQAGAFHAQGEQPPLLVAQRPDLRGGDRQARGGQAETAAQRADLLVEGRQPLVVLAAADLDEGAFGAGVRGDLGQAGPADRVGPRLPDAAVAFVAGTRGAAFAAQPVAGVAAPEPAEIPYPRGVVADDDLMPALGLTGADRPAVAAGVVDVGDADRLLAVARPRREQRPTSAAR
jgi:hypothetical protein